MAIVKGPAFSISASGNLGAICYAPWRGLMIARDVWTGTVPNTGLQVAQQAKLTTVSQAWGGTLTSDQRGTWERRAQTVIWKNRLGDPYIPSGYQLFMKWNIRRLVSGLGLKVIAPAEQEWVDVDFFRCVSGGAGTLVRLELQSGGVIVNSWGLEFDKAGPYDSGGRRPIAGEWLNRYRFDPPQDANDHQVVINKWYWYRARCVSKNGGVQNWWVKQVQVTI